MTVKELRKKLHGVIGFPVTPFRNDLSLDRDAVVENAARMASHPFCALVAPGGTGELYSLTPEEIVEVTGLAVKAVAGQLPVIAGVGFNAPISVELARGLERAGAAGLLILPPYYTHAPQSGLYDYYKAIAASTDLPLLIYARDWAVFSPDTVLRLAENLPSLAAWKDGHADMRKYQHIMSRVGDRLAWLGGAGDDCVAAYYAIGVQGFTSSLSTIAPELSLALGGAGEAKDFARIRRLSRKYVFPLYTFRDRLRGYEVAAMKQAMEMLGFRAGPVRPPLPALRPEDVEDLRKIVDAYRDLSLD